MKKWYPSILELPGMYLLQHAALHFGFRWPTQGPPPPGEVVKGCASEYGCIHKLPYEVSYVVWGWWKIIECFSISSNNDFFLKEWNSKDEVSEIHDTSDANVSWHAPTIWGEETGMHGPWLQLAFWALGSRANGRPDQGALDPMHQLRVVMRFAASKWVCGEVGWRRKQLQTRNMQILGRTYVMKSNESNVSF